MIMSLQKISETYYMTILKGIKMKKILKFVPSRLLISLTQDQNQGTNYFSQLIYKNEAQKYA